MKRTPPHGRLWFSYFRKKSPVITRDKDGKSNSLLNSGSHRWGDDFVVFSVPLHGLTSGGWECLVSDTSVPVIPDNRDANAFWWEGRRLLKFLNGLYTPRQVLVWEKARIDYNIYIDIDIIYKSAWVKKNWMPESRILICHRKKVIRKGLGGLTERGSYWMDSKGEALPVFLYFLYH